MVGACLVAVFALGAIASGSAFAAKSPWKVGADDTWGQYKYCPYQNEELEWCYAGITNGGSKGGFFEYGKVKVKLSKPITLQGGFKGSSNEVEVSPAANGGQSLEAPELKVSGGIGLFSKKLQEDYQWPAALTESWKEARRNKETAIYAKIEMAGNECFEVAGCLSTDNILFEEGTAFRLPLKVTVSGPWLETLGGGPCEIGNDENPIHINLTTSASGSAGSLRTDEEFSEIELENSRLVDTHWTIEKGSLPRGCGGAYEKVIDETLGYGVLEAFQGKSGIVVLTGSLFTGYRPYVVEKGKGNGEIP
jgi:hypothetical protein